MEKEIKFRCPFYNRMVYDTECYEMFMVAAGFFKDEKLVKSSDKKALYDMCEKCKKHGCD